MKNVMWISKPILILFCIVYGFFWVTCTPKSDDNETEEPPKKEVKPLTHKVPEVNFLLTTPAFVNKEGRSSFYRTVDMTTPPTSEAN